MQWHDFSVKITPYGPKGFKSLVMESPAGPGGSPFSPPFEDGDLKLLQNVINGLKVPYPATPEADPPHLSNLEESKPAGKTELSPEAVGKILYDALLGPRDVGSLFDTSKERTFAKGAGLRLRICLDPKDSAWWLYALPWELLHDGRGFLALDRRYSIVRCPDLKKPETRRTPAILPRILVVVSKVGQRILWEKEWQRLTSVWRKGLSVRIHRRRATTDDVLNALEPGRFQIFHFVGHGGLSERGEPQLLFEAEEEGRPHPLSGKDLAVVLQQRSIRLAVLNACDTGALPRQVSGLDPSSAMAVALLEGEIPAVVAMQYSIGDEAAIRFSETFYKHLARTGCLDSAVTKARIRLKLRKTPYLDWVKPVVYETAIVRWRPSPLRFFPLVTLFILLFLLQPPLPPCCSPPRLSGVEVDLQGHAMALKLEGDRVTNLRAAALRGFQSLTGRAILENASGCPCIWEGSTNQDMDKKKISAPWGDCAFQMDLPKNRYSEISLYLSVCAQKHLFTIKLK